MPPFSVVNFIIEVFVLELKRHIRRCSVTVTWIWFKFSPFASVKSCTIFTICENFPADNYDKNRSYWGSFFLFANFHSLPLTQPEVILWTFSLIENLLRKIIWKLKKTIGRKKVLLKARAKYADYDFDSDNSRNALSRSRTFYQSSIFSSLTLKSPASSSRKMYCEPMKWHA